MPPELQPCLLATTFWTGRQHSRQGLGLGPQTRPVLISQTIADPLAAVAHPARFKILRLLNLIEAFDWQCLCALGANEAYHHIRTPTTPYSLRRDVEAAQASRRTGASSCTAARSWRCTGLQCAFCELKRCVELEMPIACTFSLANNSKLSTATKSARGTHMVVKTS